MTSVTPNGSEVVRLTGQDGELLRKVVFPSKTGPRSYITSLPTNYVQGRPVQLAMNQGKYAMAFANESNALKKSDFFRPGDLA